MIARYGRKLRGAAVIATRLRGQRGVPFLRRERLDALRDRRVRRMVRYAARNVPYYRDLFAREGIDATRIRAAADLDRLPLIDKELVRSQPELFVADTAAARAGVAFLTSGSTGTPVSIRHDRTSLLANIAFGERERDPVNRICGGAFRPTELYVGYDSSTFKKVEAFYAESTLMPIRPLRRFMSLLEPIEKIAAAATEEPPDILVGYGGWIGLFFRTLKARGLSIPPPKLVMYMGEALPPGARSLIEDEFGIPVMSRYNAVEAFKIGFFCEQRSGFHVHEDICHVRIVTSDGRTAAPGEVGAIVISNLINRASVLLNYPIGDVASVAAETCACGRTFQLLSELEGRVEDVIHLADGRFIHPRAIWQVFKDDREVLQYQVTQLEPHRFAVKLATADDAAFERAMARARPALERLLGPDAEIEAGPRRELERGLGQKFRAVVSLARPRAAV